MSQAEDPRYDPSPKYLQIREVLVRWLTKRTIGQRLPTEMELAEKFQVSRQTIRKSLRWLEHEKIIVRRPRLGTFLAKFPTAPRDKRLTGSLEEFGELGVVTDVKLVRQGKVKPSADVQNALQPPSGELVYEFTRVRAWEGLPLLLVEAYFPSKIGDKVIDRGLGDGLMVPVLRRIHDAGIWEAYQRVDACGATKDVGEHLEVPKGFPILRVTRIFHDSSANPVALFRDHFRSDRYYYTVKLPRNGVRY